MVAVVLLYIFAGIGGSIVPANRGWRPAEQGITIWVHDNGIHTGLVVPRGNAIADWSDIVRVEDLPDPRAASDWLLFGWGDREFYVATPSWADLTPKTALVALFGSEASLVHVDHVTAPVAGPHMRSIRVSAAQYHRIAAAIRATFDLSEGRSHPVRGYGRYGVFYAAHGRYSAFRTCNEWTGSILRDGGVRVGVWTPFNFGVMRWFREETVPA